MIPLLDVAFAEKIKRTFPNTRVSWQPSKYGRKGSYINDQADKTEIATGDPAISIYRTSIIRARNMANVPHEFRGHDTRTFSNTLEKVEFEKHLYVDVTYEISIWAYARSQMNDLNRDLMFCDIYKPVEVSLGKNHYCFDLELGDPSYLEESLDDDGTEKRYNLLMDITVLSAFWMKTSEERLIHKINVKEYEHMTSGRPIFLDQIVLVKTP